MRCTHVDRKCEWEGTVGTLEEHLATCFKLLPCPKRCKDESGEIREFLKDELVKHLECECPNRDHECKHCGEKGTYTAITKTHDAVCPKKIVPCPNSECSVTIPRQDIKSHLQNECCYTIIPCRYRSVGCTATLKRQAMAEHEEEEDKLHLRIALDALSVSRSTMKNSEPMTFKLTEFQKRKNSNTGYIFPSFYTNQNGYCMAIVIYANGSGDTTGTHASVYVPIMEGKYTADLKWPFTGKITIALLNQLEDRNHYEKTLEIETEDNAQIGDDWGYRMFISLHELGLDPVKNTQYLKDDSLYFRVSVKVADHKPWLEYTVK